MVGWLPGILTKAGKLKQLYRRFGDASNCGVNCELCPVFLSICTLAFTLQLRKITEEPQLGHQKKFSAFQCRARFFSLNGHLLPVASTVLLSTVDVHSHLGRRGEASASLGICRVAELRDSSHQLTLCQSSQLVLLSARIGTPKFSWICLLLKYQRAPITRRRHLDCDTCSANEDRLLMRWFISGIFC
jgi:hypothetical protein